MSIEHDKNKSTLDDEKFIDDLYAQLSTEAEGSLDEYPSAELDENVLAAAHQSINVKATVVDLASNKKSKASRVWYVPVGIAASCLLAVSLVINQGGEVLINTQSSPQLFHQPSLERSLSSTESVMADKPVLDQKIAESEAMPMLAKTQQMDLLQTNKQRLKAGKSRQIEEKARIAFHSAKKSSAKKSNEFSVMDKREVAEIKTTPVPSERVWLSTSQYHLFVKQSRLWSAMVESDNVYLINVFYDGEQTEQYSLSKDVFNIDHFTDKTAGKFLFKQIETITE